MKESLKKWQRDDLGAIGSVKCFSGGRSSYDATGKIRGNILEQSMKFFEHVNVTTGDEAGP